SYAEEIRQAGGQIFTSHEVREIDRRPEGARLATPDGEFQATRVITCAGLWEDRVAAMTGAPREPRIVPFRGDYYILRPERRSLVRGNIYPVPDPAFPFLGVHFTPRMNGDLWLGPNAVLAFARGGYRFGTVNPRDLAELATFTGFLGFARQHWRVGIDEMRRDLSKERFLRSLQKYVPELELDDLLPGPSGVRAQAMSADGKLVDDFVVDARDGVLHVRNAPSPAATSSLVIGGMVADAFEQMG
ncbi:MAG TPA: L-2-hydroxyglutarate oxidase, partial [Thermomicrobiaceae bacterium]|nr:L-2-hydroxyglutarate oxidase [Thermomicrobiaceae bacterium]